MLYIADEMFLTGTAAEITPVRSVDHIPIGDGKRGPITERLQARSSGCSRQDRRQVGLAGADRRRAEVRPQSPAAIAV